MRQLLLDFLWSQLRTLGAFDRPDQPAGASWEAAGLLPMYEPWFAEAVRVLEIEGYLEGGARPHRPLDELWREWEEEKPAWRGNPDLAAIHLLLETTLRAYPEILTGARRATEVMFPGGSLELVENAYKTNPISMFFNQALAAEVVAHLWHRSRVEPGSAPKVLEIGAGTGATSVVVLNAIRSAGAPVGEYRYTDLSRAFLEHAERSYGPANPFLTYAILDIERPLAEQSLDVGSFDVVVATNVLHATRNIRTTLRNTKATLKQGGLLLLNEVTANTLVNHCTFGLLEGWWRYEDAGSRITGSPLLSVDGWRHVLTEEGFGSLTWPAAEGADLGQQLVVAKSDGIVRQTDPTPSETASGGTMWRVTVARPSSPQMPAPERAAARPGSGLPPMDSPSMESVSTDHLLAHVEQVTLDVLAESLRVDRAQIGRHAPFSDFGLDSIFAVHVARRISAELNLDLDATLLFEYTTLAELGEFIVVEYATKIHAAPAELEANVGAVAVTNEPVSEPEGMAVVGMSARFSQASDIDEFWQVIEQGKRCITTPPTRRADWLRFGDGVDTTAMWGGFLDGIHDFDPLFFGISVTEARQLTPELRLLMMTAWNAIEDAGYRPAELRERPTGVFVAATSSEYQVGSTEDGDGPNVMSVPVPAMIPNRLSYQLDLQGPSEVHDTTCSSSLVALHRAIRSIRAGECDQALVGGVQLNMSPVGFELMRAAGMLSTSGNVLPFQQEADGTARGEGVCAVLIKPLGSAIKDGDHVYGVVRGTGVAHGGKGVSLTAPNIRGMKSAIASAYTDAGVDPGSVAYVEAHSMSSPLADGAEIAALRSILGTAGHDTYLSSLKPCIGHTEVCSGLAALVKVLQAMRHGVIPAVPGFGKPHHDIALDGTGLRVATDNMPWPVRIDGGGRALPRRAAINSFGIGGVNAHAVLEQYVAAGSAASAPAAPQIVVLSARTKWTLRERVRRLAGRLTAPELPTWADVAFTLQVGREEMNHRIALVATTGAEAAGILDGWLTDDPVARAQVFLADGARDVTGDGSESVRSLVARGRLDLVAERWVAGAPVDWTLLHEGAQRRRIPLPGYAFERRTLFATAPVRILPDPGDRPARPEDVTDVVASVLGLERHEIDSTKPLADHGLNSLLLTGALSRLRGEFPAFRPEWLQVHHTLDEVTARLATVAVNDGPDPAVGGRFPELVHLNSVRRGRPVFWIHGALAGVESYRTIAARVDRPFYGIQARGFMTDDPPIEGIPKMARYYVEIMRAVQPEGPYDVGGFSLGGVVAYEVTRLLQVQGQVVASLMMVDSPDNSGWAKSNEVRSVSVRSAAMQVVNSLLWPAGRKHLDAVASRLIHQDDVPNAPDDTAFVHRLAELAAERGLTMGHKQLVAFIQRNIGVQIAYRIGEYEIRSLPHPNAVNATYFRNQRGVYMGDLEPYFHAIGDTFSLDHVTYWQDWKRELGALRVVDIDAANHMTILRDDGPLAVVVQTCAETYVVDGAA